MISLEGLSKAYETPAGAFTALHDLNLEIGAGQLRSKVVKITQPGGKFEVKTPNAVIGVVGTDFYVEYANGHTRVICYTGEVWVNPSSGAQVQSQSLGERRFRRTGFHRCDLFVQLLRPARPIIRVRGSSPVIQPASASEGRMRVVLAHAGAFLARS